MRISRTFVAATLVFSLLAVCPAQSQVIRHRDLRPGPTHELVQHADVATGADGSIVFIWEENRYQGGNSDDHAAVQWWSPAGFPLADAHRVDTDGHVASAMISSDLRGGHIIGWEWVQSGREYAFFGNFTDGRGEAFGEDVEIDRDDVGPVIEAGLAGIGLGSVFVWAQNGLWGRYYDTARVPLGDVFSISPGTATGLAIDVAPLPDGGYVVVWIAMRNSYADAPEIPSWGRIYGPDGQPRTERFPLCDADDLFAVARVAASDTGAITVVARRWNDAAESAEIVARRFDAGGNADGEAFVVTLGTPQVVPWAPDLDYDHHGNLLVVWSNNSPGFQTLLPPSARSYGSSGEPLGPVIALSTKPAAGVRVSRLGPGFYAGTGFVTVQWIYWNGVDAQILQLCAPETAVCGDGSIAHGCEQCDDGAANSDEQPDACRSDCRLAACGDGALDSAEQCDDGNAVSCDGCSAACELEPGATCGDGSVAAGCGEQCDDGVENSDSLADACRTTCRRPACGDGVIDSGEDCDDGNVGSCDGCGGDCRAELGPACGDGIVERGCGEQCDDANDVAGDGCSASCQLERIPGQGSPASDCLAEWIVANTSGGALLDDRGFPRYRQACSDGDAGCDQDGDADGICTFAVRVCFNNTNLAGCTVGAGVERWALVAPSERDAARTPLAAVIREAFTDAVDALMPPPLAADVCTETIAVEVPLGGEEGGYRDARLSLKAQAAALGVTDKDKLSLACRAPR